MSYILNPYWFGGTVSPPATPDSNDMEYWSFGRPFVAIERIATDDAGDMEYWSFGSPVTGIKQ